MKKIVTLIVIFISTTCFSQKGKYFGFYRYCGYPGCIFQNSWIELKKHKQFEYNLFSTQGETNCRQIIGTWKIVNDTLNLETKDKRKYYFLFLKSNIKRLDSDNLQKIAKRENAQLIDFEISTWGNNIKEMELLSIWLDRQNKIDTKEIIEYSEKSCR